MLQVPELQLWCNPFPAAPGATHSEAGVPRQLMEDHRDAEIHLQPLEDPMPEQMDAQRWL